MSENTLDILAPIRRVTIGDGYSDLLVDLKKSHGAYIVDAMSGDEYLDFFSFYASSPLGFNHPQMTEDQEFLEKLKYAALNKISNSDFYSAEMAEFVETFERVAMPESFKYAFFISGGALAVENALKASFDWKVRKNFEKGYEGEQGSKVIHFKEAFHGRTGYTLSLTNTSDPRKHQYFPKFNWPRITNPKITFPIEEHMDQILEAEEEAIDEILEAFARFKDDIAAIILEPIQGEGGDNHFRAGFLRELREIADEREAMLIFDEIQTGVGLTGKFWSYEHFDGAEPDLIAFGKKTQVCGFMSTGRIDEVENNVFKETSRINSTWGGNIVDMVRSAKYLQIIEEENLVSHADRMGKHLLKRMEEIQERYPETISNLRGRGLMAAFDLKTKGARDNFKKELKQRKLLMLGSGVKSIRFRPPLIIEEDHIDKMVEILEAVIQNRE